MPWTGEITSSMENCMIFSKDKWLSLSKKNLQVHDHRSKYYFSTHLFFTDSRQKRTFSWFDFQLPWLKVNWVNSVVVFSSWSFHKPICVTKTKSQCSENFPFQNQWVWMIDCGQGLWTGKTNYTLIKKCWAMQPSALNDNQLVHVFLDPARSPCKRL